MQIGPYRVRGEVGAGRCSVVFRAYDPRLDRDVAIKVLRRGLDRESLIRFRREARAHAGLRHPNVVAVHDYGDEGAVPYLVQELVEGESLGARIARLGPLAPREAAGTVAQVARAAAAAHRHGFLHRDLKPDNVLLDAGDGRPLLTDFGLVKDRFDAGKPALTPTVGLVGTVGYMAPELIRGAGEAAPATEVFALGATFYAALTGHPPFRGDDLGEVLAATLADRRARIATLRPDVGPELDAICERCLAPDPADRYGGAAELADALERAARAPAADEAEAKPAAAGEDAEGGTARVDPLGVLRKRRRAPETDRLAKRARRRFADRDLAGALADLDFAIDMAPDRVDLRLMRGVVRRWSGDQTGAIRDYDRALALEPTSFAALAARGVAQLQLRRHAEAREDLFRALELMPRRHPSRERIEALAGEARLELAAQSTALLGRRRAEPISG